MGDEGDGNRKTKMMKEKGRRFFIVSSSKEKKRCQAEHSACRTGQLQVFNFSHHNNNNNNIFFTFFTGHEEETTSVERKIVRGGGGNQKNPANPQRCGRNQKKINFTRQREFTISKNGHPFSTWEISDYEIGSFPFYFFSFLF